LFCVGCPFATDIKGMEKDPTIPVATNAKYNRLAFDRFIIHKLVTYYLRDSSSL
jgi:hypothetical protein